MKHIVIATTILLGLCTGIASAQNCCAPAVPQQGVLGETVALPHTLDVGLHYQYLRSRDMYAGSEKIVNKSEKTADFSNATLSLAYGIIPGFGVNALLPCSWKEKSQTSHGLLSEKVSDGIGDAVIIARYSPIQRSFVTYRELSVSLGVKIPTGATDLVHKGGVLGEEMQPGTGSWDYQASLSFFQGFELVDFILSGTYVMTTEHHGYEFGDQFLYLAVSDFHITERLNLSASLTGLVRASDFEKGVELTSTSRHQLWIVPGVKFQVIPNVFGLQAYFEQPLYQHFDGEQLASSYNIRLSATYSISLRKSDEDEE